MNSRAGVDRHQGGVHHHASRLAVEEGDTIASRAQKGKMAEQVDRRQRWLLTAALLS